MVVPASELTIQILQRIISNLIPPRRLPRLDLAVVPEDARTMVIVPTILDSVNGVDDLIAHLEVQALGNVDPHIHFAMLSDVRDAADRDAAAGRRDPGGGARRHRGAQREAWQRPERSILPVSPPRQWNAREGLWMGWERKRGKIEEFNRLLRGATDTSFAIQVGDVDDPAERPLLHHARQRHAAPARRARELVGIITHPLNRPTIDPAVGRVTDGYGILQPRVSVTFASAAGSLFARLYCRAHGRRSVHDGGLGHLPGSVRAKASSPARGCTTSTRSWRRWTTRVPENALLSHDLFEGLHARVALVSDVEFVDEYPSSRARARPPAASLDSRRLADSLLAVSVRAVAARRQAQHAAAHRPLEDSRQPAAQPRRADAARDAGRGLDGAAGSALVLDDGGARRHCLAAPAAARTPAGRSAAGRSRSRCSGAISATTRPPRWRRLLLGLTFLAYNAWKTVHAIVVTLVRLAVHERRLLEWETAATTRAVGRPGRAKGRAGSCRRDEGQSRSLPVIVALLIVVRGWRHCASARRFCSCGSWRPAVAYWLSLPVGPRQRPLSRRGPRAAPTHGAQDLAVLRDVRDRRAPRGCRRTTIRRAAAWSRSSRGRTSPTNIAMGLLSTLAAHDLGYLPTDVCSSSASTGR